MRTCVQDTVTMDAKDLRTESALSERNNDGSKYSQSGGIALHCDRNKSYQDIGSNSLSKVEVQNARPCAVIGPDRVVPPQPPNESYIKKGPSEPWPCMDNAYHTRRPPEYPHKLANFQNPSRNISPRQTFQENMQRIMVPPTYNSAKISDDTNYAQLSDRSNAIPKNVKINVPPEAKFCDVPYTVYPTSNEQKHVRNPEMCLSSVNSPHTRTAPHGWPPGSVNIRPSRAYGASELYQYQEYPSCAGPRPVVPRPNRSVPEESGYVYADPFYHQEGNIRFKPYPTVKERFPQQRYEYIGNYANSFHPPPPFPSHKYEIQKPVPPHPYPPYPPIKYLDRISEPVMENYTRNQQQSYNIPYRNQIIHPNFGPVLGNGPQNKIHSYPPDAHIKTVTPNKLPYDNAKAYIEYENGRPKMYPASESYICNEMGRMHPMKSQVIMPNYPSLNMHGIPPYYKKDNQQMKNYDYIQAHFRSMDPNLNVQNPMVRHAPVFSPTTLAISPTDSTTSNDTSQTLGTSQDDCGYVSQSSTASIRSMDSGINRIQNDYLRKYYDSRFGPIIRTSSMLSKSDINSNHSSKEKKNIDVRQFLQMWNEGDEEIEDNNSKEIIMQAAPKNDNNFSKTREGITQPNQEQLYVLGLVNVPSEELGKYEHIQKVSKLPENIKGYNHIELLNQFEEAIESSNMVNYKTSSPKNFQIPSKGVLPKQTSSILPPRPLSPLDVEAKISQSVIHKEVGCNFEIKPCSPKMLNVEVATPVQNILSERAIEKVANPVMLKSPKINSIDENIDCNIIKRPDHRLINNEPVRIPSCKMIKTQFSNNNSIDSIKSSYSLQDLESNSGLCLASLPRLDNDIELNFPEVNQQFINANKGDSGISNSLKDLPTLDVLEHSDSQNKDKRNEIHSLTQERDVVKSPCIVDTEKEFSKLSKYRKAKAHPSDFKENINAVRTDSVIIKNPENSKNYEEHSIFSPHSLNKQNDLQQSPINLTSQGGTTDADKTETVTNIEPHEAEPGKEKSIEIAIDFSLNKSLPNEKGECIVNKNDKVPEILTRNTADTLNSVDDHLTNIPTLSDCDKKFQNTFTNDTIINKNIILSPIKNCDFQAVAQISNDNNKNNTDSTHNPLLDEILTETECLASAPNVKDECAKDVNDGSNNSLLSIEFVSPAVELLQSDVRDCSNYLLDIDKNNIVDTDFNKMSNRFTESCLNNDLKNHTADIPDNLDQKDIIENAVNNIVKVIDQDDFSDIANIGKVIESQLDIEKPKDNAFQKVADSLVQIQHYKDCISSDTIGEDILENSAQHSIIPEGETDIRNVNDYQLESLNEQGSAPSFDLPSNSIVNYRSNDSHLENTDLDAESKFDLPLLNKIDKQRPNDCRLEKHDVVERDCHFDIPSSINLEEHKSNENTSNNLKTESKCNSPSPNNLKIQKPNEDISEAVNLETESNYDVHSSNIMDQGRSNDYRAEAPELRTDSNFDLHCSSEIIKHKSNACNLGTTGLEKKCNFNIPSSSDLDMYKPNDNKSNITELDTDCNFDLHSSNDIDTLKSNDCKSSINELETDYNFDLPSSSDIDKDKPNDYKSNTTEIETDCNFDLPSSSKIDMNNTNDCELNTNERQNNSNFDLPPFDDVGKVKPNDCQSESGVTDSDSNFDLPYSNNIEQLKSNICNTDTNVIETDSQTSILSSNIHQHNLNNRRSEGTDSNFVLSALSDADKHSLNDRSSKATELLTDPNFILPSPNNIVKHSPVNYHTKDTERESCFDFNPTPPINIVTYISNDDLIKNTDTVVSLNSASDYGVCLDKSTEKQHSESILVKNTETVLETLHSMSPIEEEKEKLNSQRIRYLSYGSKEMYSPWIQKLVMFSEGNTHVVKRSNRSALLETELEKMEFSNELDQLFDETDNLINQKTDSTIIIPALAIKKHITATENLIECLTTKPLSNSDINNMYHTSYVECKNTKNIDVHATEIENLTNTDTIGKNDEFCSTLESTYNSAYEEESLCDSSTESLAVNNTSVNAENNCNEIVYQRTEGPLDTHDTLSNVEKPTNNVSPEVREQQVSQSPCDNKVSEDCEQSNNNKEILEQYIKNSSNKIPLDSGKKSNTKNEVAGEWDQKSNCASEESNERERGSFCNDKNTQQCGDRLSNCNNEELIELDLCNNADLVQSDTQSNCSNEETEQLDGLPYYDDEFPEQSGKQSSCYDVLYQFDEQSNCPNEVLQHWDKQFICNDIDLGSSTVVENREMENNEICTKLRDKEVMFLNKSRQPLKRSLSDSALNIYNDKEQSHEGREESIQLVWPFKRRKMNNVNNDILAQNLCNIIQSNRRNSISSIYNEENVSFCILIDNSCIITEEENDDHESYTELPEECLTEIQNDCTKDEEHIIEMAEDISTPQQEDDYTYSEAYVTQEEDAKALEESWVEDVACVETVISDDIAEDIEISGPSSSKDDVFSDNDESGVFSISEHTDKVKYIYGDKMCNDDAQFVETLYNTPQMDVNKTLIQRESLISTEYYDNDSLEKILSESNDQKLSPYVPEYAEPIFSPGVIDVNETVNIRTNMQIESISAMQSEAIDVIDTGIDKANNETVKLNQLFEKTQNDTTHSCESSVDNVFTYKVNDENTNYISSSSPEVSSTTSEEKNSGILLKITNYKGSRISQINAVRRDSERPSCKFTEDKDYVQSHLNYPVHRPLLTKAAQKYIPPLKESMRDLKVKLSLPQHSLLKLKQLKKSKDEPKVCKRNISVPRISKKPKPKFEDVLKSIDEIQFKRHKEKTKKTKKSIPKVVIKKNENGSHYASTSNKNEFNPDLTGRKWQPWVFIEKNHFIDKMAIKKKTKAIYSHRKKTYVLAEKFQKYKSVNSAKFVISPPISNCPSAGLKYTIRLKHNY